MMGIPAVVYDGDNAKAIVEAMGLQEGDAVVILEPHKTIILRASQLDMMFEAAASFEGFRRDHFWPQTATPRPPPTGLIRKLVEEGES